MIKHLKKIVVSIALILTINFITPTYSHALDVGGILLKPITSILVAPIDIANSWLTYSIVGISNGFKSWTGTTIDDITNAMSDQSTYDKYK